MEQDNEKMLKDFVYRKLWTGDKGSIEVVGAWFEAWGSVNLRKMVALGTGRVGCPANLWGLLKV